MAQKKALGLLVFVLFSFLLLLGSRVYSSRPLAAGFQSASSHQTGILAFLQSTRESTALPPFISWLQSLGLTPDHTLFITIGDRDYVPTLRNLRGRLDQWGYGQNFVVLCLDQFCTDHQNSFHGYGGYNGEPVAFVKFVTNLDLAKHSYNFVFLDGDVYLTGMQDPFADMLPLADDSWDIQFQPDGAEPSLELNIGWYFAKATPNTVEFFRRSYAKWNVTEEWDQKAMNEIAWIMEQEEHSISIHRLQESKYKNFMLYPWEDDLFGAEEAAQKFVEESTLIHFTCIEQDLKMYFGLNFGGFGDLQQYYSSPPPLLGTTNISGLLGSVHAQVVLAIQLSSATGRTFIWPDVVDMVQRQVAEGSGEELYYHRPKHAGIRALSYASAKNAGVKLVESRYFSNRQKETSKPPLHQVVMDVADYALGGDLYSLENRITNLPRTEVVMLDFANYSPRLPEQPHLSSNLSSIEAHWFANRFDQYGVKEYVGPLFDQIEKCSQADREDFCLRNCN